MPTITSASYNKDHELNKINRGTNRYDLGGTGFTGVTANGIGLCPSQGLVDPTSITIVQQSDTAIMGHFRWAEPMIDDGGELGDGDGTMGATVDGQPQPPFQTAVTYPPAPEPAEAKQAAAK